MVIKKSTKTEDLVFEKLDAFINENPSLSIKCGRYLMKHVRRVVQPKGTLRADYIFEAANGYFYMSHKADEFCHNGYGSLGSKAYAYDENNEKDKNRSLYQVPRIWAWAKAAFQYCLDSTKQNLIFKKGIGKKKRGLYCWEPEIDEAPFRGVWCDPPDDICCLQVYGAEFKYIDSLVDDKGKIFTDNNCQLCCVGQPTFTPKDDYCLLEFSGGAHSSGEVPVGDDRPYMSLHTNLGKRQTEYSISPGTIIFGNLGSMLRREITLALQLEKDDKKRIRKGTRLESIKWNI